MKVFWTFITINLSLFISQAWARRGFPIPIFIIFSAKYWWITVICIVVIFLCCFRKCLCRSRHHENQKRNCEQDKLNQQKIELAMLNSDNDVVLQPIYRNRYNHIVSDDNSGTPKRLDDKKKGL